MAKKSRKRSGNSWYYGISWIVRLVLAIIPVTSCVVHAIARISSGKLLNIVVGILGFIFGWNILWIIDLITTILRTKLIFS